MPRRPQSHSEQLRAQRDHVYWKSRSDKHEIKFYHSADWLRTRAKQLQLQPLCCHCAAAGAVKPGNVVDHIVPLKDAPELGLALSNLQTLCKACHNRKTYEESKATVSQRGAD